MMQLSLPYWHVDAFADRIFAGNQAAVIPLEEWLPDAVLTAIAAENMFAETAFLLPDASGAADYELRWFTPTVEVAMCGHATLASGHVLLSQEGVGSAVGDTITFRTRQAGVLSVARAAEGYELVLPTTPVAPRDDPALLASLGTQGAVFRSTGGAEDVAIVLLEDEAAVRALAPDMRALAATELLAICTAPGARTDVVSRVFAPAWGIDEDPVTGSAHAALAPFWAERLGRATFTAHQASARGGDLTCRLASDSEGRERTVLTGRCITVVEGRFFLEI